MNGEQMGPRRSALRIGLGAIVVFVGVGAVIGAAAITLKHYPAVAPTSGQSGNDRSSAVVAVLTPIVASIAGIVGLYFGVSATGSARGQQAQTNTQVAQSLSETAKTTSQSAQTVSDLAESTRLLAEHTARIGAGSGSPVVPDAPTATSRAETGQRGADVPGGAQAAEEQAPAEPGSAPAEDATREAGDDTQSGGDRESGAAASDPSGRTPAGGELGGAGNQGA